MTHWMRTAFIVALKLHVSQAGWDDWVQNDGAVGLLSVLAGLAGGALLLLAYVCYVYRRRSATPPKQHLAPSGPVDAVVGGRCADNDEDDDGAEDDDADRGGGSEQAEADKRSLRSDGLSSAQDGLAVDRSSCGWSTETLLSGTLPAAIATSYYDVVEAVEQPPADPSFSVPPRPPSPPPPPSPHPIDHSSRPIGEPLYAEAQNSLATDRRDSQRATQEPGDPGQLYAGLGVAETKDSVYTHLSMSGPHGAAAAENGDSAGAARARDQYGAQAESDTAPIIYEQAASDTAPAIYQQLLQ